MKTVLLGKTKNFFKANLHMHTTISDGQMTPEEVKAPVTPKRRFR